MKNSIMLLMIFSASFISCIDEQDVIVQGMSPVYVAWDDISTIKTENPRPFINAGKIVSLGNYIFINEATKGIHVVDNSNPIEPKSIAFWLINGNREFIVKDKTLYADNGRHIIVSDISNILQIKPIEIIKDIYNHRLLEEFPDGYNGKFECYIPEKGILLDWQVKQLTNPLCER
jgi:hypothetical protein